MLVEQSKKAHDVFNYILTKAASNVEIETRVNTTYTFIESDDMDITYGLISNDETKFYALSIISTGYNDVISFDRLFEQDDDKSKLIWDLLKAGGINEYSVKVLINGNIPSNTADLKNIDWSEVRLK
jgi:hypothetical protein